MIETILLDAQTPPAVMQEALLQWSTADVLGLDTEGEDSNKHDGLAKIAEKKFIWDTRRCTMTGFSFYKQGSDKAYYVNLGHKDVENRLPESFVHDIMAMRKPGSILISHNAPFEIMMFKSCFGIVLTDIVCSMQLAVTHHGPDNYDQARFTKTPLNGFRPLVASVLKEFAGYEGTNRDMNADQQFIFSQFIGKASDAAHSYNGYVKTMSYSYGLKKLAKTLFDYDMTTFEQVVGDKVHMGNLTGEETREYGAEDAIYAVKVYQWLIDDLMKTNPAVIMTFFEQENPMIHVFADCWMDGIRLDMQEIVARQAVERANYAQTIRDTKKAIKALLPFPDGPNEVMMEQQARWYPNNWLKKRVQIENWANSKDDDDDFEQCLQISNPIGNAWAEVDGGGRLNLLHYYSMRILLHDLLGHKLVRVGGTVATDAEARGRMVKTFERAGNTKAVELLNLFTKLSGIEQAMKLYITPYLNLIDPETGRVYPTINSLLATRRMAMSNPNAMQLAKRGESAYVRNFFLPDEADHVVLSADWSSVELVLIGEYSGDREFKSVFSQVPYGDLHTGAAADCLGWNESDFAALKRGNNPGNIPLIDLDGMPMAMPQSYFKLMRTEIGKGANFNYWYSGALGTVGETLGWDSDTMWAAVERYRNRFPEAEQWRVDLGEEISRKGFITLPDGHRRERFEATQPWALNMQRKFASLSAAPAMISYANMAIKAIAARARNQAVNAMIQGSCAGMAKRAILEINRTADHRLFRFMKPIHDELVFSVHKDYVLEFIPLLKAAMNHQPIFVKDLPLHCTVALGKTFGVKDQIELDEAPKIEGVIPAEFVNQALPDHVIAEVVRYVMESKND
jgi:DNA polymerase I-like protein with 3'-5' exonuclease and polymerase domains